jgi:hypothetical protein
MKNFLASLAVLLVTVLVMLGVSELVIRQFLDPLDHLQPIVEANPEMGHRIAPGTGGHDDWGYRNKAVPKHADLVFLGDSMVYGTATTYKASIPSALKAELGGEVYAMALGGYGAPHYAMLFDRALGLSPSTVLVGVSFGNNFLHAFNFVYNQKHERFAPMRLPQFSNVPTFDSVNVRVDKPTLMRSVLEWLGQHSVLYRATAARLDFLRVYKQRALGDDYLQIDDKNGQLHTVIPVSGVGRINPSEPKVAEGKRITMTLIDEMKRKADAAGVKFAIVLFPTQFTVFRSELLTNPRYPALARKAVADETALIESVSSELGAKGIATIDLRVPLEQAVAQGKRIYPINDGHPNAEGNRIIAAYLASKVVPPAAR